MRIRNFRSGFTIVELLIVIVVLGILSTLIIVAYSSVKTRAVDASIRSDLKQNRNKLFEHKSATGNFPSWVTDSGSSCASPKGTVDGSGSYCPILSNGAFYGAGYEVQNNGDNFRFSIGKGTTAYTITDAGVITTQQCTHNTGMTAYEGYSKVYTCPDNTAMYSQ